MAMRHNRANKNQFDAWNRKKSMFSPELFAQNLEFWLTVREYQIGDYSEKYFPNQKHIRLSISPIRTGVSADLLNHF